MEKVSPVMVNPAGGAIVMVPVTGPGSSSGSAEAVRPSAIDSVATIARVSAIDSSFFSFLIFLLRFLYDIFYLRFIRSRPYGCIITFHCHKCVTFRIFSVEKLYLCYFGILFCLKVAVGPVCLVFAVVFGGMLVVVGFGFFFVFCRFLYLIPGVSHGLVFFGEKS